MKSSKLPFFDFRRSETLLFLRWLWERPACERLRLWLWKHGGDAFFGRLLWLYGHSLHWRERHIYIKKHGATPILQRAMAFASLGFGLIYLCTGVGETGSPIMAILDGWAGPWLTHVLLTEIVFGCHLPVVTPHQVAAVPLTASSLLLVIAVYEWPTEKDFAQASAGSAASHMTDIRLMRLFRMMLTGHIVGESYWLLFVVAALSEWQGHLSAIWFGVCIVTMHYSLYLHTNADFEKMRGEVTRMRLRLFPGKRTAVVLPSEGASLTEYHT